MKQKVTTMSGNNNVIKTCHYKKKYFLIYTFKYVGNGAKHRGKQPVILKYKRKN